MRKPTGPDAGQSAVSAAVGLLSRRDHSREELKRKLRSRGFVVADIQDAIERVDDWGYLDDRRFAEGYVRGKAYAGLGPGRISNELRERGVDAELIRAVMAEAEQDWFELCWERCERKFVGADTRDFKQRAKIQRYLAYRGFNMDQIRYALETLREAADGAA